MKKILLTLGVVAATAAPIAISVSCGKATISNRADGRLNKVFEFKDVDGNYNPYADWNKTIAGPLSIPAGSNHQMLQSKLEDLQQRSENLNNEIRQASGNAISFYTVSDSNNSVPIDFEIKLGWDLSKIEQIKEALKINVLLKLDKNDDNLNNVFYVASNVDVKFACGNDQVSDTMRKMVEVYFNPKMPNFIGAPFEQVPSITKEQMIEFMAKREEMCQRIDYFAHEVAHYSGDFKSEIDTLVSEWLAEQTQRVQEIKDNLIDLIQREDTMLTPVKFLNNIDWTSFNPK